MRTLAFIGDDPGQKGAGCLLGVLDDPDGERHGEVVYCGVWDHALRKTDKGDHVDPVHFAQSVRSHALAAGTQGADIIAEWHQPVPVERAVFERPNIGGRRFGASSIVTQIANFGMVVSAALCSSDFRANVVEEADPGGGQWYAEAGVKVPKGGDRKTESIRAAEALLSSWRARKGFAEFRGKAGDLTPDQADAVLLAYLGVQRWLGRTAVPAKAGGAAQARERAKAFRDHEVARAMEGVPMRSRLPTGTLGCPRCEAFREERCEGGKTTCRERKFALAARLKPARLDVGVDAQRFVALVGGWKSLSYVRGKWRCEGSGPSIDRLLVDAAIDTGLVRLTLDDKRRPVWVVRANSAWDQAQSTVENVAPPKSVVLT